MKAELDHLFGGPQAGFLLVFLETAVPMWTAAAAAWPPERRSREARETGDVLAHDSGVLLGWDRSSPPSVLSITAEQAAAGARTAGFRRGDILNAIAKTLALGALLPGGVTWFGRHWCAAPHGTCPGVIPAVWLPGRASRPTAQDAR